MADYEETLRLQTQNEALRQELALARQRIAELEKKLQAKTANSQKIGGMTRTPVESSMLAMVGYDAEQKTLELEFNSGKVYHYYDVPLKVYRDMLKAESKGSYFRGLIDGMYRYNEVKGNRYKR